MKALFVLLICICFSGLGALALVSQYFDSSTGFPYGWTKSPEISNWGWVGTSMAGGTAGELRLIYDPAQPTGTYRFISPAFDTRKVHNMRFSFKHYLNDYEYNFANYTIGAAISNNNGSTWTTLWSETTTGDIFPTTVTVDPITFDKGMAQYTRICFFFTGTLYDNIDAWYIDNIVLAYDNTLGSGTWAGYQFYGIEGSLIVPNGHTFEIGAGAQLQFNADKYFQVQGRLLLNGTSSHYVTFSTASTSVYWTGLFLNGVNPANDSTLINYAYISQSSGGGISIYDTDKVRISNCIIRDNREGYGAGIYAHNSDIIIEGCDILENTADGVASGLYCLNSTPTVRNNRIYYNHCLGYGAAFQLNNCNLNKVKGNVIANNSFDSGGYGVSISSSCTGTFQRNLIANNADGGLILAAGIDVLNCDIDNNYGYGVYNQSGPTNIINCIIWGNNNSEIHNTGSAAGLTVSYSCLQGTEITGNVPPTYNLWCNTVSNPVFVNPTTGVGTAYNALTADWNLQVGSPCIDTGNPYIGTDPDGSPLDMGALPRYLKPIITRARDYAPDQGHQLDLRWNRSDADKSCVYNDYYSIWREGESRSDNAIILHNPSELSPELAGLNREIVWRDRNRTWYFITQMSGLGFSDYGYIAPTLQDSSSTGTHAANYLVVYDIANTGTWTSVPVSGYTVDNIPPYTPARMDITKTGTNQFNLTWEPVTEGGFEGNSYPEINLITYKVYASDRPDFVISSATYLMSTTNPYAVLMSQTADKRFYKITATDSE